MAETVKAAWLNSGSYLAREDRTVIRTLRAWTGVVNYGDLAVYAMGTPDMRTQTFPGRCVIDGTESPASQGSYVFAPPDIATLTHAASTSLPRRDIVGVRVYDADFSGGSYLCQREILQGTPASSPVDPTRPANWLDLARVTIRANTTSVLQSDIGDLRERNDMRSFYCKLHQNPAQSVPSGAWNQQTLTNIDADPANMTISSSIWVPVSGWYLIEHRTSLNAGSNNYMLGSSAVLNGTTYVDQKFTPYSTAWTFQGIAGGMCMRFVAKGTPVSLWCYQNLGSATTTAVTDEHDWPLLSVTLIGA